jgi:hypothetical protein
VALVYPPPHLVNCFGGFLLGLFVILFLINFVDLLIHFIFSKGPFYVLAIFPLFPLESHG